MFLRENTLDWRKSAEIRAIAGCGFVDADSSHMVMFVTGPSNNTPVANCQNRYPSPSRRPGRYPTRSLDSCRGIDALRRSLACPLGAGAIFFAFHRKSGASKSVGKTKKGYRACQGKFGLSPFRRFLGFRPVVTPCLSKDCSERALVQPRQRLRAAMPSPARPLVPGPTCSIVRTIRASADKQLKICATRRDDMIDGQRALARLAVLRVCARAELTTTFRPEGRA